MRTGWLLLFAFVLAADLAAIILEHPTLQYIFKPLIVPALAAYFVHSTKGLSKFFQTPVLAALFFSWVGDVLLMFAGTNERFFLFGLASFLVAHLCYITYFRRVWATEGILLKPVLLAAVTAYYVILILVLFGHLGNMKIPVLVYGLVISMMLLLALHVWFIANRTAGYWMTAGALMFVLSDSILAINKFYQPFAMAGVFIMLTYGLAQFMLVKGATQYFQASRKH
jgi:uncharacterized membrane protein YhhN